MKSIRIYLGDLVHNYQSLGPFTFPLNVGYIAAYANEYFEGDAQLEFKLFKDPQGMLSAAKESPPDLVGLSNYTWNENLNLQVLRQIKQYVPRVTSLMGGPNYNFFDEEQYFLDRPFLDYYVVNQGETGFLNLLHGYVENALPHQAHTTLEMDNVAYYDIKQQRTVKGDITQRFKELDTIPSPYLEGLLDEFFEQNLLIPIMETMRGCPFDCTFCAWGDDWLRRSNKFSLERIQAELDYIAKRIKHSNYLYLGDSNFGMLRRDADIASIISRNSKKTGYPRNFYTSWAKNASKRVIDIAATLGDLVPSVTVSYQSMDSATLANVKRKNISIDQFDEVSVAVRESGVETHCDLILGMPGETHESYLNGLRNAFKQGFNRIYVFNCRMLGGTELNTPKSRNQFGIKSKFRLINLCYGKYGDNISIDHEEMITCTHSMSEEEILSMRPVNWLVYLFWNYRYYLAAMKLALQLDVNPVDVILGVIQQLDASDTDLGRMYADFIHESRSEWFDTSEELYAHFSQPENFDLLTGGEFAKLNMKYTTQVLFKYKPQMDDIVYGVLSDLISDSVGSMRDEYLGVLGEVMRFSSLQTLDIVDWFSDNNEKETSSEFNTDILEWQHGGYHKPILDYRCHVPMNFSFSLPPDQHERLTVVALENEYDDVDRSFMKMLEYIRIGDMFLAVKKEKSVAHIDSLGDSGGRAIESWLHDV